MNTNYTISEPQKSVLWIQIQVVLGDTEADLGERPVGLDPSPYF